MNSFQQKFRKYINEYRLFAPDDRILLSVSGGVDSSVLCHLMAATHQNWAIAHVNFQLRGEESDLDEVFVKQLAEKYSVPFFIQKFATEDYARQQKISIQMAARALRRTWFEELLTQEDYQYTALAHHHNDQLETLLLNLAKGSGISGLRAMLPKQDCWVRPLLWATKEDILDYAEKQQLTWREDRSNAEDKYQRNRIRHHIIPVLKEINPSLLTTSQQTLERLREVEAFFQAEVFRLRELSVRKEKGRLIISREIIIQHPQATSLLTEWLAPYGFNWEDATQITASLARQPQPGLQFQSASHRLWVDRGELILTEISNSTETQTHLLHSQGATNQISSGQLIGKIISADNYQIQSDSLLAALDYHQLTFPLTLRPWQAGDRFQPLGMNHNKKISDFLVDLKMPRYLKDQVLVLLSEDEIVWVVGHRIDNRFRVTQQTQQVYEIRWQPN
ncbi:MAG: tRNA lysidine(34) synthetase TilS [Bacteroidota bacterium]